MTYGEALRRVLAESSTSQADLARAIGRSNSYVAQLCNGKIKEPTISVAVSIADALGTDVQAFIDLMHEDGLPSV